MREELTSRKFINFTKSENLDQLLVGRNNNLNLIRLACALVVMFSHAVLITTGNKKLEPLMESTGQSVGWYAVVVFFALSGILITKSFDRRPQIGEFISARILRLWPALLASLILTVFFVGPTVTDVSIDRYFSEKSTWLYMLRNATLFSLQYKLPGIYADNPLSGVINGSMWSLFYEVACYLIILFLGTFGALKDRRVFFVFFLLMVIVHICLAPFPELDGILYRVRLLALVGLPFFTGAAAYLWREHITLSPLVAISLWMLPLLGYGTNYAVTSIIIPLTYTTFYFGFCVKNFLLNYNKVGDYSYGVYIYGHMIQQTVQHFFKDFDTVQNLLVSVPLTLIISWLSWNLIEKRALTFVVPFGKWLEKQGRR